MDLPDALRREMERRRISQKAAADEMGVSQGVISRWMSGDLVPNAESCVRIAEFLQRPVPTVLEMVGRIPPTQTSAIQQAWDAFQRHVLDLFGPDPATWESQLKTYAGVKSMVTPPVPIALSDKRAIQRRAAKKSSQRDDEAAEASYNTGHLSQADQGHQLAMYPALAVGAR